jgi:hypothetical protein
VGASLTTCADCKAGKYTASAGVNTECDA